MMRTLRAGGALKAFIVATLAVGGALPVDAQEWNTIVQRGGYTEASKTVRNVVHEAVDQTEGRIALQVRGTPDDQLVAAIAEMFAPRDRKFRANTSVDRIAFETCGHVSAEYRGRVLLANKERFIGSVLSGLKGEMIPLKLPACLVVNDYIRYNILPGDSVAALAGTISSRTYDPDYCAELAKVNEFDVCSLSQAKSLKPDTRIWLPKPKETRLWTVVAKFNAGPGEDGLEALAGWIANSVTNSTVTDAPNAQNLKIAPLPPSSTPQGVVPSATCTRSIPPFDTGKIVGVLDRLRAAVGQGKIRRGEPVRIGVIDSGLYDDVRKPFFERIPVVGQEYQFEDNKPVRNLITWDSEGTWARSYPSGTEDVSPDGSQFSDHGTHVAGLLVGGADFWTDLRGTKYSASLMPQYIGTYIPEIVPVKILSASPGDPVPKAEEATFGEAFAWLAGRVAANISVINVSAVVRGGKKMPDELRKYEQSGVIFVSAAGNDYVEDDDNTLDKEDINRAIMPAMKSNPSQKYFITVGALDTEELAGNAASLGKPARFSQRGKKYVDLFAPGTCVRSFGKQHPLTEDVAYSGTSQAAPLVSFSAAMLLRFGVRGERVKWRLMDTVDASPDLADISRSGGSLNLAKALDYLDDIVVLKKTPRGEYRRGTLVHVVDGTEQKPGYLTSLCTGAPNEGLETLRRVVVVGDNAIQVVSDKEDSFFYQACTPKPGLAFKLIPSDGLPAENFKLSEVREIIPRPRWKK